VIDGCEYREALQAVRIAGGVANNVVPDEVLVVLNHRFAPDRDVETAFASVRDVIDGALDTSLGDEVVLEDSSAAAAPGLSHPVLARLVAASGSPPRAKLGWTDVSYFAARGMPAANFGPGEPSLAHTAGERVERADLEQAYRTLQEVVG
jgi:succinyl-diaminopimelate desuccinylase